MSLRSVIETNKQRKDFMLLKEEAFIDWLEEQKADKILGRMGCNDEHPLCLYVDECLPGKVVKSYTTIQNIYLFPDQASIQKFFMNKGLIEYEGDVIDYMILEDPFVLWIEKYPLPIWAQDLHNHFLNEEGEIYDDSSSEKNEGACSADVLRYLEEMHD